MTNWTWNRWLSVFVIVVAVVAIVASMADLIDILLMLGSSPEHSAVGGDPNPVPFFRYSTQLSLASALFALALTPFFLIGGVRAFQYRESGRRMLAGAFAIRTVWYIGCLLFWIYHLHHFADRPEVFPPLLAWGGLTAIVVSGGIGALFFVILRTGSTIESFREREEEVQRIEVISSGHRETSGSPAAQNVVPSRSRASAAR